MKALRIVHLFPRELGIYGDVGNVTTVRQRAVWRGFDVDVVEHHPGDRLPDDADLVHIGNGSLAGQEVARIDLGVHAETLLDWKRADVPFLAIGAGWQLLGREVNSGGAVTPAVGIFASTATLLGSRAVGELVLDSELGRVAGFENHGSTTTLFDGVAPLGTVLRRESAATGLTEGVRDGSSIGTNLHGAFLPMNPTWADYLLRAALRHAGLAEGLTTNDRLAAVDASAAESRKAIAGRLRLD